MFDYQTLYVCEVIYLLTFNETELLLFDKTKLANYFKFTSKFINCCGRIYRAIG